MSDAPELPEWAVSYYKRTSSAFSFCSPPSALHYLGRVRARNMADAAQVAMTEWPREGLRHDNLQILPVRPEP